LAFLAVAGLRRGLFSSLQLAAQTGTGLYEDRIKALYAENATKGRLVVDLNELRAYDGPETNRYALCSLTLTSPSLVSLSLFLWPLCLHQSGS
jgi:hypothetical protein